MAGSGGQELMGDRGARPRAATDDDRCLDDFADDLRVGSTVSHEHEPPPEEAKDLLADPPPADRVKVGLRLERDQ
jgi:hypothetical protein|tara:strand:- start:330 stop:554 length:225 start_codon:yes stop_codon:yes gene_type:complete